MYVFVHALLGHIIQVGTVHVCVGSRVQTSAPPWLRQGTRATTRLAVEVVQARGHC
jgi:hypothetical protein